MRLLGAAVAGSIAGMVGAGIWAAIAYFTHAEVGWIAWGIGFLVGIAVNVAVGRSEDAGAGILAMAIAILAVLGGKYAAVSLLVDHEVQQMLAKAAVTDEDLMVGVADDVVEEWESQGRKLKWAEGKSVDTATAEADYPPGVWPEAKRRWAAFTADERETRKKTAAENQAMMAGALADMAKGEGFRGSFGVFDLLWFALAAGTAFKVACGGDTAGSQRSRG